MAAQRVHTQRAGRSCRPSLGSLRHIVVVGLFEPFCDYPALPQRLKAASSADRKLLDDMQASWECRMLTFNNLTGKTQLDATSSARSFGH